MSAQMTLSDILARGVTMDWYEGVALVRAIATFLAETSAPAIPELHQIEISGAGDINVTGGTARAEPVRRLGQLLQATLGRTEVPVQLRLIVMEATAPTPAFGSIREFADALAYFERPGRETVLRALYVRAAAALPVSSAGPAPTLDAVAPLPTPDPNTGTRRAPVKQKPRAIMVAGLAVLLLIGAAAMWYARPAGVTVGPRDVSAMPRQASNAVGAAALAGVSAVTERVGLGRLVRAEAVGAEAPTVGDRSAAKLVKVSRPSVHRVDPRTAPIVVFDLDPLPHSDVELVAYATDEPAAAGRVAQTPVEEDENTIFSPESAGVSPPVGVRPQLPRVLPPGVKPEQLCRVDLIVSEAGTVESVKLLGVPHNVHDFMFLSAAKAWQFRPALKDGEPVRFRKTVWIVSQ
jgi:hypothetical protein